MNNAWGIIFELQQLRQKGNLPERFNKVITDAIGELKFRDALEPVEEWGHWMCPNCYKELDSTARFCMDCGQAVEL